MILGALGGYLTPILTASGSGNYVGLFTYLAFLNVALVGCAVWRNWSFLKPLALVATVLMFGGWLANSRFDAGDHAMVWGTQWFAVLHGAIFLFGSTAPPVIWKRTSNRHDLFALVVTSFSFVGLTWVLFHNRPDEQMALVSWGMSALHAALFGVTYARVTNVDRMPRVHLALAAAFFTLAIPLQLNDSAYWGATWCVEGFIFTAVGVYFADRQMCTTAAIVLLLAVARLAGWDWASAPRLVTGTARRFAMRHVRGRWTDDALGRWALSARALGACANRKRKNSMPPLPECLPCWERYCCSPRRCCNCTIGFTWVRSGRSRRWCSLSSASWSATGGTAQSECACLPPRRRG